MSISSPANDVKAVGARPRRHDAAAAFVENMPETRANLAMGRTMRMVAACVGGLMVSPWVEWQYGLTVAALIIIHELGLVPLVFARIIEPNLERAPHVSHRAYATSNLLGAALYASIWAPAFASGEVLGAFIGAGWYWGSLIHNNIYFSRDRLVLLSTMAPPVIAAVALPFFMDLPWWGPWMALVLTAQGLVTMTMAMRDRNTLAHTAEKHQHARHLAEEANVQKSRFLTTMSHELRTPLNAIIGYAEIIEEDLESAREDASPDDARRIRRAARHLLTLINEVLDLSKIEAGRLELVNGPVDVATLLREIEETVRPIGAGNRNKVVLDIVGRVPTIETDRARLKQCLLNLATNACKFTSSGRITIRASIEDRGGGPMLEVAVVDTGVGIKREDQARLFQPFVQVDGKETRTQDGTGLGLVITRRLAQAMGGDVTLVSSPGVGSTFTLSIPAREAVAARARTSFATLSGADQNTPAAVHAGAHVLVIEDDLAAHDLTCRALERLFPSVACVALGEEGLSQIEAAPPALVILDINLPDISGWTVLERLKASAATRDIPVLVVTIDDDRAHALALGACEHMVKPVDRDRLTAAAMRYALPRQADTQSQTARPAEATDVKQFG
jgi:signal transduction histidine kinase/ActR/RegA family two-component response regulator